ncbi:MAG: Gfo/Idh/MocA family oxidoreductase [Clostridia bacterium]
MKNIAIIGAGGIAGKMADTINAVDGANAYAIASRSLEKAEEFAAKHNFDVAYGSYEELVADPKIDLVYVATPHSHHYKCMKMCLEAGKKVLCEKAFTVNADEAKEILAMAKEKNLLVAEAIWTRYLPARKMINDLIDAGEIGERVSMMANLGGNLTGRDRIEKKELAGGALLDMGVYVLTLMRMFFPENIVETSSMVDQEADGVDKLESLCLRLEERKMVNLVCTTRSMMRSGATISGTKGFIQFVGATNPESILVCRPRENYEKVYEIPKQINGFEYELEACMKAIDDGKIECEQMPHSEIIFMMELMDSFRKSWGYEIPEVR